MTKSDASPQQQVDRPKCDCCENPATNEAYDQAEIPTQGKFTEKVSTGRVRRGCDEHPASERVRRS